jgi:flagellar FliL protein
MSKPAETPAADAADAPKKSGLKGLLFGVLGAAALGGGAFFAVYSGLADKVLGGGHDEHAAVEAVVGDVAFVPMEPIMISLPPGSSSRFLRFTGQLEVVPDRAEEVVQVMPRVLDVLNTYLRAVEVRDLEQPSSAARLRAQMLRRVQVVTGEGRVRDLLVTEFVMN